jgi:putative chitinase
MAINRTFFFEQARATLFQGRTLSPPQRAGLVAILDRWDAAHAAQDQRFLAYMLATTHETNARFQQIREYGRGRDRAYGKPAGPGGQVYYGRGFVQLTWLENYRRFAALVSADLVGNPDLALDLRIATDIMFTGMLRGSFTGRKLADYFAGDRSDWANARRIINGMDKAQLIAGYARQFYAALSQAI